VLGIVVGRAKNGEGAPVASSTLALPEPTPSLKRIEERLAAAQPTATEEPELPIGDVMTHLENATPASVATAAPKPTTKMLVNATPVPSATKAPATPAPASSAVAAVSATPGPSATATVVAKAEKGAFTLQVVAYNDAKQADAEVAALKAHGLEAYAVESSIPGKGTVHRVRVGRYATRVAAETAAHDITAAEPSAHPMVVQYE